MNRTYTSLPYIEKPVASGNFGSGGRLPVDTVVWHTAQGTLAGTLSWFNNPASQVSSNYVMDQDGTLYAMLEEYNVPYTNGDYNSNQRSITIETIDDGNPNIARSDGLYAAASKITRDICQFYGIPLDRGHVKGHREVSSSHPQCPGNLDLDRIVREANPPSETCEQKLGKVKGIVYGPGTSWTKYVKLKELIPQ